MQRIDTADFTRRTARSRSFATACMLIVGLGAVMPAPPAGAQDLAPLRDVDFRDNGNYDTELVELGRLLFFDEVLSGNRNISCATCHHPDFATADGLSLPLGEGGSGIGVARGAGSGRTRVRARVPRNTPALFNLGAHQFRSLFHDGRVAENGAEPSGFTTPAGADLPTGLNNVLAAQALFPLASDIEMAGQPNENEIGRAAARGRLGGNDGVWDLVADRVREIPEYVALFAAAFDDVTGPEDISIVHAANAIAEFEMDAFRTDDSPFDRYLRGDVQALSAQQLRGMDLF